MTVSNYDFVWQQGEDAEINLIYKESDGTPIDLTGWKLRMDVSGGLITTPYVFNTDDEDPETFDEATLNANGEIHIVVPRSVTLTGGALYNAVGQTVLGYDIFLRAPSGKQRKILRGNITIEGSKTLWV